MSFPSDENSLKMTIQDLKEVLSRAQLDSLEIGEALKQMEAILSEIEAKARRHGFIPQVFVPMPASV